MENLLQIKSDLRELLNCPFDFKEIRIVDDKLRVKITISNKVITAEGKSINEIIKQLNDGLL